MAACDVSSSVCTTPIMPSITHLKMQIKCRFPECFLVSVVCILYLIPLLFELSGRLNNIGVWRREAVCCSACSTSPRPVTAMCRARPRTGLVAGCAWASNAAPTWRPWMSTATQTPTLKRKADIKALMKCHSSTLYVLVGRHLLNH